MSLTPGEARSALKDIETTENRAAAARNAYHAAPHLIIWGLVWIVGYLTMAIRPDLYWIWFPLAVVGFAASAFFAQRAGATGAFGWRYGATVGVVFVFVFALIAILGPNDTNQANAISPLIVGLAYAICGLWTKGWRMLPLGLALTALTLLGYFWLPDYFAYYLAAVGGGGLILGGVWMRSV